MAQEIITTSLFDDTNLVSYYQFEGNSNDSKDGNNGTDTAVTYNATNPQFNQNALSNGTSSLIDLGAGSNLNITTDITIGGWIYITTSDTSINGMVGKGDNVSPFEQYGLYEQNGTCAMRVRNSADTVFESTRASAGINQWQLVVGTISGTTVTCYVNGVAGATATVTGTRATAVANCEILSNNISNNPTWLRGRVDDICIFNRALTATEISQWSAGTLPTRAVASGYSYFL